MLQAYVFFVSFNSFLKIKIVTILCRYLYSWGDHFCKNSSNLKRSKATSKTLLLDERASISSIHSSNNLQARWCCTFFHSVLVPCLFKWCAPLLNYLYLLILWWVFFNFKTKNEAFLKHPTLSSYVLVTFGSFNS